MTELMAALLGGLLALGGSYLATAKQVNAEQTKDRGALIFAFWVAAREHRDRCVREAVSLSCTMDEEVPEFDKRRSQWWQSFGDVFDWERVELNPLLA